MTDPLAAAQRLYEAFASNDPRRILDALTVDFVGQVSEGMPLGVGGRHEGREAMLRNCWGKIFAAYDVRVEPDRYHVSGDDHVIAVGYYRGAGRETGREFEAAFAHVLTVADGLVAGLVQITDTERWWTAAPAASGARRSAAG